MSLTEEKFNELTPAYFMLRLKGMRAQQTQQYRNEWERTRWLALFMVMPHSKRKLKPTDLIRFPWEKIAVNVKDVIQANKAIFDKLTPPNDSDRKNSL